MRSLRKWLGKYKPITWVVILVLIVFIVVPSLFWPARTEAVATIATRGTATTAVTNNGTTISIALPGSVVEGDLLLATIADSTGTTITAPSGWTRVSPNAGTPTTCIGGANVTTVQVWWKPAALNEAGPYSFTLNATTYAAGGIQAYSGVDTTTPIDNTTIGACTNSAGASTALNASAFTTISANAWVIAVWGQMTQTGNTNAITVATGLTARVSATSTNTCGLLCNTAEATVSQSDLVQPTAGDTGIKSATSSQSGQSTGYLLGLRPAPDSTYSQSAYRWFTNIDSADYIGIVSNPHATGDDKASATAVDGTNGYIYVAGYDANGASTTPQWRIEKRRTSTGELCSATVCGTQFGTNGVVTEDVGSSTSEQINAISIDVSGGVMYLGGYDSAGAGTPQWRIEKRSLTDGSLVTSFNSGGATPGALTENVASSTDERINALAIDITGGYMYVGGYDTAGSGTTRQWRLEKRKLSDSSLCTAAACGTQFGTNGISTAFSGGDSSKPDEMRSIVIDSAGTSIYVGGQDNTPPSAGKVEWRVEKRVAATGALGTGFGGTGTVCTTVGVYCSDPNTNGDDEVNALAIDSTYLFIGGFDETAGNGDFSWRVERITLATNTPTTIITDNPISGSSAKDQVQSLYSDGTNLYVGGSDHGNGGEWRFMKRTVAGATVAGFGDAVGAVYSNPTAGDDQLNGMTVDATNGFIFGAGYDSTGGNEWRMEKHKTSDGSSGFVSTLAAQDTNFSATSNQVVRLRMLIHLSTYVLYPSISKQFKLQYSLKSGTCDSAFVGESYFDVTTASTPIRYFDNPGPASGATTVAVTGDPSHGGDTNILQTYQEANNFTNLLSIASGQDALWDFPITESGSAFGGYCLRIVNSDGTSTGITNSVIPEITFCDRLTTPDIVLRGGAYFCNEAKRRFYWSL